MLHARQGTLAITPLQSQACRAQGAATHQLQLRAGGLRGAQALRGARGRRQVVGRGLGQRQLLGGRGELLEGRNARGRWCGRACKEALHSTPSNLQSTPLPILAALLRRTSSKPPPSSSSSSISTSPSSASCPVAASSAAAACSSAASTPTGGSSGRSRGSVGGISGVGEAGCKRWVGLGWDLDMCEGCTRGLQEGTQPRSQESACISLTLLLLSLLRCGLGRRLGARAPAARRGRRLRQAACGCGGCRGWPLALLRLEPRGLGAAAVSNLHHLPVHPAGLAAGVEGQAGCTWKWLTRHDAWLRPAHTARQPWQRPCLREAAWSVGPAPAPASGSARSRPRASDSSASMRRVTLCEGNAFGWGRSAWGPHCSRRHVCPSDAVPGKACVRASLGAVAAVACGRAPAGRLRLALLAAPSLLLLSLLVLLLLALLRGAAALAAHHCHAPHNFPHLAARAGEAGAAAASSQLSGHSTATLQGACQQRHRQPCPCSALPKPSMLFFKMAPCLVDLQLAPLRQVLLLHGALHQLQRIRGRS